MTTDPRTPPDGSGHVWSMPVRGASDSREVSEHDVDGPDAAIIPFRPRAVALVEGAGESARDFIGKAKAAVRVRGRLERFHGLVPRARPRLAPATPVTVALYAADSASTRRATAATTATSGRDSRRARSHRTSTDTTRP